MLRGQSASAMGERTPEMTSYIRYEDWANSHGPGGITEFDAFFKGVAEARYVIRRVTRIVDEQARLQALEPLEHQLLIQLFGAEGRTLNVNRLGDRIDVPAAVASRLVKGLEERSLVKRRKSEIDRRVTDVHLTQRGRDLCVTVWENVRPHMEYFQKLLDDEAKRIALAVFGFYVGVAHEFTDQLD
ncbi:MAG: MarR family transcriptional regulator [Nitriliruptorales bacterium]|nr:MarR family transcriptional regulator [Nitriliruptorales bacterium]